MEFKELIAKRRSVRKFTDREVPREVVDRILAEALSAPSARNTRTTRFLVVDDPALVARMAEMRDYGSAFLKGAPLAVLRKAISGAKTPRFRPRCSSWPASTKGWLRAGCTSTDGPAARTPPTERGPPITCGRSCPFPTAANPSAPSPWAILTSPPPRCRLRTTRRGFSGSDNVKGRPSRRPLTFHISVMRSRRMSRICFLSCGALIGLGM